MGIQLVDAIPATKADVTQFWLQPAPKHKYRPLSGLQDAQVPETDTRGSTSA
jgi:hypothetical protein